MTSYIPYMQLTSSLASRPADIAFHPAFWEGAMHRLARTIHADFRDIPAGKQLFLIRLVRGLANHKRAFRAYSILVESFGQPLYHIRNLAKTQQNPDERMVYVMHLDDLYEQWRKREESCWSAADCLCLTTLVGALLGIVLAAFTQHTTQVGIRPHPFLNMYEPPHM